MKLRQSLATQKWVVAEASALSVRAPDFRFEILRANNGEQLKATGDQYSIIATAIDAETAVALVALPQFYAACLEVMKMDANRQFDGEALKLRETAFDLVVEQARAALDAANAADEVNAND